ncbi:MAG: amidohydrolase family protein [Flavobacteriales bacterium]
MSNFMNYKKIMLATLSIISYILSPLQAQEMDFEGYNPISTLIVPKNEVKKAKFPFIDVHSHQYRMPNQDLSELIMAMDSLNEGIMVNLSGGSGDKLVGSITNIKKNYPNRFVVFANIDFEGASDSEWTKKAVAQLEEDVKNGARGLKIFKSLGLRNKDSAGKRLAIDDARLDPIDGDNERWLELKTHPRRKRTDTDPAPWEQIIGEQHHVFKKHPNTNFIAAHMGWYANDLQKLSELMDEIPNMNVGISAVIAELGRQPQNAHKFFVKYQDRILFGKDSWKPEEFPTYFRVLETNDEYFPYYKKYHAFWAMYGIGLPDNVLKKVYYKNALRLIPGLDARLFPMD